MATRNDISLDETRNGHTAKKYTCPACGKRHRFVRYYDFTNGQYLEEKYGRCDREENCGYFEAPYQDLKDKYNQDKQARESTRVHNQIVTRHQNEKPKAPIIAVDREIVKTTLQFYEQNKLIAFFTSLIGKDLTHEIVNRYFIGTGKGGATIFWQIDRFMRVRTGQRIMYGDNGKRLREVPPQRLFKVEQGYTPCLFGEHLLYTIGDKIPVAIVESEKTAALASAYLPTLNGQPVIWMAAGGVNGLTQEKIKPLSNKTVILVPDFSFHARATWGQIPMRKKRNDKGQNIPDPDGEIQNDFLPYSEKLRAIGCDVRFFDPAPDTWDSSDIGDLLINMKPPSQKVRQPNFAALKIGGKDKNAENSPKQPQNEQSHVNLLAGESSFKITSKKGERISILIEPHHLQNKVEEILNKPEVVNLINIFDICSGSVTKYHNDEHE